MSSPNSAPNNNNNNSNGNSRRFTSSSPLFFSSSPAPYEDPGTNRSVATPRQPSQLREGKCYLGRFRDLLLIFT